LRKRQNSKNEWFFEFFVEGTQREIFLIKDNGRTDQKWRTALYPRPGVMFRSVR
jgi:hypothetical protein